MKNQRWIRSPLLAALAVVATQAAGPTLAAPDDGGDQSRIRQGARIAPVPLNLKGRNPGLVWLGSYIVNAQGGCNDCHTNPSYVADASGKLVVNAAAYLGGGQRFGPPPPAPPVAISANITPDASGRPAGLTLSEFVAVLRTGVDPDDGHHLAVMPWRVYGQMTDRDLEAIYEYLSSIPSLP